MLLLGTQSFTLCMKTAYMYARTLYTSANTFLKKIAASTFIATKARSMIAIIL